MKVPPQSRSNHAQTARPRRPWCRLAEMLLAWYRSHARPLPWRNTTDPYAIWVSEIMLQQTQVKTVLPYWQRWMQALPNLEALASAHPDRLHKLWEGLGYYRRVRLMQQAAQIILRDHAGHFPTDHSAVLALPGIGRYTAGAICSIAFNQPTPILDGNVIRVLTRVFGLGGDPRQKELQNQLWDLAGHFVAAAARLPKEVGVNRACSDINQALMELGALVCLPQAPLCSSCPWQQSCQALRTGRTHLLPESAPRERAQARRFLALVWEQTNRVLACQRPAGVVNAHLWEFPNVERPGTGAWAEEEFLAGFGLKPSDVEATWTLRHAITRYRITLRALHVRSPVESAALASSHVWLRLPELEALALTSAHRKVSTHFLRRKTVD